MLTLIFNGSPRKNGDTAHMIAALKSTLGGEVEEISAYRDKIAACIDCRYCWKNPGCAQKDDMQRVYDIIARADNIVIASPVYFSELTGKMLDVASRLQMYYAYKRFTGNSIPIKTPKRGAILLCGGGDGAPDKARQTAEGLLGEMGAGCVACAISKKTDIKPAAQDTEALEAAREIGRMLSDY